MVGSILQINFHSLPTVVVMGLPALTGGGCSRKCCSGSSWTSSCVFSSMVRLEERGRVGEVTGVGVEVSPDVVGEARDDRMVEGRVVKGDGKKSCRGKDVDRGRGVVDGNFIAVEGGISVKFKAIISLKIEG